MFMTFVKFRCAHLWVPLSFVFFLVPRFITNSSTIYVHFLHCVDGANDTVKPPDRHNYSHQVEAHCCVVRTRRPDHTWHVIRTNPPVARKYTQTHEKLTQPKVHARNDVENQRNKYRTTERFAMSTRQYIVKSVGPHRVGRIFMATAKNNKIVFNVWFVGRNQGWGTYRTGLLLAFYVRKYWFWFHAA